MEETTPSPNRPQRKHIKTALLYKLIGAAVICGLFFWGVKHYAAGLAEKKLSAAVGKISDIMTVSWQSVEVRLLSSDVVVRNISLKHKDGARATIKRALVYDFYRKSPRPNYAAVNLKGLRAKVDETNFGDLAKQIKAWGYKTLDGDVTLDVFFDPTGKILYINTLELAIANAGRLRLRFIVDRFNPSRPWPVAMAALVIREGALEYNDDSLLKNLTEIAWRQDEAFMKYLVGELAYDIVEARKQADTYAVRSLSAVKKFVRHFFLLRLKIPIKNIKCQIKEGDHF